MTVSRLCLGTAQLGSNYGVANRAGRPDDSACDAILSRAVEAGVLAWDTAAGYGDAEERIGKFLSEWGRENRPKIVTKLGTVPAGLDGASLELWCKTQLERSRRRLGVSRLHTVLVHDVGSLVHYGQRLWQVLQSQRELGKVEQLGASIYRPEDAEQLWRFHDLQAIQLPFNLLDCRCITSGVLDRCRELGVTVYARSAYLQGALLLPVHELQQKLPALVAPRNRLAAMLQESDLTIVEAALPFVLSWEAVDYAVVGVESVCQLEQTVAYAEGRLSRELRDAIRKEFVKVAAAAIDPRKWQVAWLSEPS